MSGRVFVVQRPVFKGQGGRWEDKFDLSPAAEFGRLVECTPAGEMPRDVGELMRCLQSSMADFDEGDSLLLTGDPIAIALATLVARQAASGVHVLKWDRILRAYERRLLPV